MTNMIPYLVVNKAIDAIEFYQRLFDAKFLARRTFSPEMGKKHGFPADFDYERSTMEATIKIFGNHVFLTDDRESDRSDTGRVDITLEFDSLEQMTHVFEKARKLDCQIKMELKEIFKGRYYALFVDPFGIGWLLNYQTSSNHAKE